MVSRKRGGLRGQGGGDERPLHVGFYTPALPDSGNPNGIVTYVRIMRDALRSLGHKVTVVTLEQDSSFIRTARLPTCLFRRGSRSCASA